MNFLKRVPLPLSGVALGFAALGNLLAAYNMSFKVICGVLAFIGLILITGKYLSDIEAFTTDMKNPVIASVSGTYTMALMLLAVYINSVVPAFAIALWYIAVVLHFILMIYFTLNIVLKIKIPDEMMKIAASFFIVYVGIAVASVTAPAFKNMALGHICFWIGFILYIPFFIYVSYRYIKLGNKKIEAKALACIYAAPASLCVAGYIGSFEQKNILFLGGLYIFSLLMYLVGTAVAIDLFVSFVKNNDFRFYPSLAGLTFPFVISAIATKQFNAVLTKTDIQMWIRPVLPLIFNIELVIAILGVIFAAVCFARHVFFSGVKS
ncbi:TDT family transporter [Lachnoanaerobaculum saburreum]|uniref:C4-dicarboxylate transporter/malic acid transport protein n=1 Tax=Lachnoanaerobaculum saburreum DSM 3986 TaxID=887325 RepID=E6LPX2_9FIRM|nr:TDT family transporter [Lachnoanaerobaculum saburreum]EFU76040.1 C4-dicarboxylate transporter/malic acid transport protein [Lachnoanaerobaculum saburreum DSM 3986]